MLNQKTLGRVCIVSFRRCHNIPYSNNQIVNYWLFGLFAVGLYFVWFKWMIFIWLCDCEIMLLRQMMMGDIGQADELAA